MNLLPLPDSENIQETKSSDNNVPQGERFVGSLMSMQIRTDLISIGYDIINLKMKLDELIARNQTLKSQCVNYRQQITDLQRLTPTQLQTTTTTTTIAENININWNNQQKTDDISQMKSQVGSFLNGVINDATLQCDKDNRKTITAMDIVNALRKNKHFFDDK